MNKILFLNPPGDKPYLRDMYCSSVAKGYYLYHPMDLIVLSGIIGERHSIDVLDALAVKMGKEDCLRRIVEGGYDAVIFLTSSASYENDMRFMKEVKDAGVKRIIGSGGILLSDAKKALIENCCIDAVLLDFTSDSILKYLEKNETDIFEPIDNIVYRRGDCIVSGEKRPLNKTFKLPLPRVKLFPMDSYRAFQARSHPFASVLASMGCPFPCTFCIYGTIKYAARDVANIIEELQNIKESGIKEVYFRDYTFGVDKRQTRELCQEMIDKKLNIGWSCQSRVDVLNEEIIELMKMSGCHTILFGVESGSDEMLNRMRKGFSVAQIRETFGLCRRHGIKTIGYFIIGLPGETRGSAEETIALARELKCDFASFSIAMPYTGTALYDQVSETIDSDTPSGLDSASSRPVFSTEALSRDDIWKLRNKAVKNFYFRPSYILQKLFSMRSPRDLGLFIRQGLWLLSNSRD